MDGYLRDLHKVVLGVRYSIALQLGGYSKAWHSGD